MNWYQTIKQAVAAPTYLDIGHDATPDSVKDCPVTLWLWDGDKVHTQPMSADNVEILHTDVFSDALFRKHLFSGRYDKCRGMVSAAGDRQYRNQEPPPQLVKQLYSIFPDALVYYSTFGRGMQPVMADCAKCKRKIG